MSGSGLTRTRASVQHIASTEDADVLADVYFGWVGAAIPGVSVERSDPIVSMHLLGIERPAIELENVEREPDRTAYVVSGGFMVATEPKGIFAFEKISPDTLRITLERFAPRLPRFIYAISHAVIHALVMWWFGRHMGRPSLEGETK